MTYKAAQSTMHQLELPTALIICMLLVGGCLRPTHGTSPHDLTLGPADLSFETGAQRPPTEKTLYALAKILAAQGKDTECEQVLERTISEHPQFLPAYCMLAEVQVRRRRIDQAIRTVYAGLALSPDDPVLLNNAGMCWLLRRNFNNALDMFTKAAGAAPYNARYRANVAVALGMMGRNEEALSLYEQILPPAQAQHNLALLCRARETLQ